GGGGWRAGGGIDEVELALRREVAAAALAAAAAPAPPREEVREEVVDALELEALLVAPRLEAAGRRSFRPAAEARRERVARAPRLLRVEAALERHLSELVVVAPLRRVGEHVVGARDVLELVLGGLVAGVHGGVVAPGELAVGLADRVLVGVARDAEDRIEVLLLARLRLRHQRRSRRSAVSSSSSGCSIRSRMPSSVWYE